MSEIKMLNLFRCSSNEKRMLEKDIHYFVTDYFDGIKIVYIPVVQSTVHALIEPSCR